MVVSDVSLTAYELAFAALSLCQSIPTHLQPKGWQFPPPTACILAITPDVSDTSIDKVQFKIIATGYSGELGPFLHAEEVVFTKWQRACYQYE